MLRCPLSGSWLLYIPPPVGRPAWSRSVASTAGPAPKGRGRASSERQRSASTSRISPRGRDRDGRSGGGRGCNRGGAEAKSPMHGESFVPTDIASPHNEIGGRVGGRSGGKIPVLLALRCGSSSCARQLAPGEDAVDAPQREDPACSKGGESPVLPMDITSQAMPSPYMEDHRGCSFRSPIERGGGVGRRATRVSSRLVSSRLVFLNS